jgi:hypothetical protein
MRIGSVAAVEWTGSENIPHRVPDGMIMEGKVHHRFVKSGWNLVITHHACNNNNNNDNNDCNIMIIMMIIIIRLKIK